MYENNQKQISSNVMSCLQKWIQAHIDMLFPKNVCLNIIKSALQNADAVLLLSVQSMVQKTL
jgi:hypothetical protein